MLASVIATAIALAGTAAGSPLALHPDNPHLFLFRGRPTVLVTSGEHYGAVLNRDFEFQPYLDELAARGFNLTRTFSGTYREVPGSFKIRNNTLAPRPDRFACPWPLRDGKFDLDHFDDAYFQRLKAFLGEASRRGIVVEYVLFCPLYNDELWDVNPMNARNNRNGVGGVPRTEVYTLAHADLLERQLAFVRKAVTELNAFDNLYFEICNEPYFGGVTLQWQRRVADVIAETEKTLPNRHLIAQNIANGKAKVENPHPAVSIFNFHYASPPDAVPLNWQLDRPIAFDETGFKGTGDRVYRRQAWEFLLAGGSVFSHLDYSFTPDHEDGTAPVEPPTPGGGGPTFRRQLAFLKQFLDGFDLPSMKPLSALPLAADQKAAPYHALVEPGKQYAIYFPEGPKTRFELELPAGDYEATWVDPRSARTLTTVSIRPPGGRFTIDSPEYTEDIALKIRRK